MLKTDIGTMNKLLQWKIHETEDIEDMARLIHITVIKSSDSQVLGCV